MKKILSVLFAVVLAFGAFVVANAETAATEKLQFDKDGNFRIMQISDIQDGTVLTPATKKFLKEVVLDAQPDIIVLTGDNISAGSSTVGVHAIDLQLVKYGINNYMSVFEEIGIPVALVFGNHDAEELVTKEEQMEFYSAYDCCIAVDEGTALSGCGTYNVPIYSSTDASKVAYNLWMIDSNMYDADGYDHVHKDQLDWYVKTSNELKEQNGGKAVPSMMFQHIVVKEIYDIIEEIPATEKDKRECVESDGKYYAFNPENYVTGELNETPCPPAVNGGQFTTVKNQGDVVAMFFGHDHKNSFVVNYQGVDLVNTPGAGFGSYGDHGRGVRIIDLKEGSEEYKTSVITYLDFYADNDYMLSQFELYGNEFSVGEKILAFFKTIIFGITVLF